MFLAFTMVFVYLTTSFFLLLYSCCQCTCRICIFYIFAFRQLFCIFYCIVLFFWISLLLFHFKSIFTFFFYWKFKELNINLSSNKWNFFSLFFYKMNTHTHSERKESSVSFRNVYYNLQLRCVCPYVRWSWDDKMCRWNEMKWILITTYLHS